MSIFDKISGRFGDLIDEVRIPEELHRLHESATQSIAQNDAKAALAALLPTVARYPNIQRTHILIARAHRQLGQWRAALDACQRAIDIREQATLHLMAAELLLEHRHIKEALEHLQKATNLPDSTSIERELSFTLAKVYVAHAQFERAERELRRCLRVDPSNLKAAHTLAEIVARRDAQEARNLLIQVDRARTESTTQRLLAEILESEGKFKEALALASELESHDPKVALLLGRLFLALEKHDEANSALANSVPQDDGQRVEFAFLKGKCALALGLWDEARSQFSTTLGLMPDHPEALIGLGESELALGHPEVAGGFFLQAMQSPERGNALSGVGRSFISRGDKAGGRHFLEEALREPLQPLQRATIHRTLATLLNDPVEILGHLLDANIDDPKAPASSIEDTLKTLEPKFNWPHDPMNPMAIEALLREVITWISKDPRLIDFLATAQNLLNKLESPLSIAIVGEFNAGKSTLLNALLEEDLLPVGVLPTTAHTGIVRFGPRRAARVYWTEKQPEEVTFEEASSSMKDNAAQIQRVDFMFPHPVLRAVEFWDTPGFNALEERHEQVASQALTRAEAILWVMDANQVLSATELDRIDSVRLGAERLIVVINKIDRLGRNFEKQVEELIEYVEDHIGNHIAGVFAVSAQQAISSRPNEPAAFQQFREFLDERVFTRAGRIKVLEIQEQLFGMFVTMDAFGRGRYSALSRNRHELRHVLDWITNDVNQHHAALIETQRRETEDQLSFLLLSMEHEIADALRPSKQLLNRMQIPPEDIDFITRIMLNRFTTLLTQQFRAVEKHLDEEEAALARKLDRLCAELPAIDSRMFHRTIEGFFDELRAHRTLLRETYVAHAAAMAETRLDALGPEIFTTLDADRAMWRPRLRRLLPDVTKHTYNALSHALEDWQTRVQHTLARMDRDLKLMEMESTHRYNLSEYITKLEAAPSQGPAATGETLP